MNGDYTYQSNDDNGLPLLAQLFVDIGNFFSNLFGGGGQSLPPNFYLFQHRLTFHRHPLYGQIIGVQVLVSQGSDTPAAQLGNIHDFTTLTVNLGPDFGGTFHITVDRYGHVYFGIGVQAGRSPGFLGLSYTSGNLHPLTGKPATPSELSGYLTGYSIDCSIGAFGGGGDVSYTFLTPLQGQYAFSYGAFSTQSGCAITNSFQIPGT